LPEDVVKRRPTIAAAVAYPTLALALLGGSAGADCTPPTPGQDGDGANKVPPQKVKGEKGAKKGDPKPGDKAPPPPPPPPGGIGRRPQPQPGEITVVLDGKLHGDDALVIHAHGPGEPCRRGEG
jgi:hypothetical protein